jgi:hypothetical protein
MSMNGTETREKGSSEAAKHKVRLVRQTGQTEKEPHG